MPGRQGCIAIFEAGPSSSLGVDRDADRVRVVLDAVGAFVERAQDADDAAQVNVEIPQLYGEIDAVGEGGRRLPEELGVIGDRRVGRAAAVGGLRRAEG